MQTNNHFTNDSKNISGNNSRNIEIPSRLKEFVAIDGDCLFVAKAKKGSPELINFESRLVKSKRVSRKKFLELPALQQKQKEIISKAGNQEHEIDQSVIAKEAFMLFVEASKEGVSDIHIRVHKNFADILFRINGGMQKYKDVTASYAKAFLSTIYTVVADGDAASHTYYQPSSFQDGRISDSEYLPDALHGIRIASGPKVDGRFMVLRLLYKEAAHAQGNLPDRLKSLGYYNLHIKAVQFMRNRPTGINIVAGPTGSGKSTTLKHVLESISIERPDLNIMTVEDPPEYPMQGVVQMPVTNTDDNEGRENAFGNAIRASLRSDPDIIMVGEIRDHESAKLALRAAQTGHQVWTTIHANSAFGIISRLGDILTTSELSDPLIYLCDPMILTGLIFQRLVRVSCPKCRIPLVGNEKKLPDDGVFNRLSSVIDLTSNKNVFIKGEGCPKCKGTGISGRTIVSEIVTPDPEMLKILKETGGVEAPRKYWLEKQKGKTCLSHAIEKIEAGIIDPVEAERAVGPLTQDQIFLDGVLEEEELDELY